MTAIPDIATVSALIRETAEAEILPRFGRLKEDDIRKKQAGSLVTIADTASEAWLSRALTDLMPGSVVVAEEEAEGNPAVLDRLAGLGPVWIIDPLDGTANFAAGREDFAVIVAFAVAGRVRAGWLHHPLRNVTISAEQGGGAWAAGKRLRVAPVGEVADMTGSLGRRLRIKPDVAGRFADVTHLRSCGVEYMTLVEGDLHFAYYRRMKPWDHLAGALIHAEAGGHNACLDGEPYRPASSGELSPGGWGLLMAPDAESWERVAKILRPAVAEMM